MGLPPIISLLTATFPILRWVRFPAEVFFAAESVLLIDAAAIDVVRDLFKNCLRVRLLDILIFLAIILPDNLLSEQKARAGRLEV